MSDTIADRLKHARITAGYRTAKEFAERHGVQQPTYHLHETGKRALSSEVAVRYAMWLGVSVDWLLTGEESPNLTADERDLIERYRSLDERGRQLLRVMARASSDPSSSSK